MEIKKDEVYYVAQAVNDKLFLLEDKIKKVKDLKEFMPEREYTVLMREYEKEKKVLIEVKNRSEQQIYNDAHSIH